MKLLLGSSVSRSMLVAHGEGYVHAVSILLGMGLNATMARISLRSFKAKLSRALGELVIYFPKCLPEEARESRG
jgi:hypothetical protein